MSDSKDQEQKTVKGCPCLSSKGKEVVVITIEACCKRNCEVLQKSGKGHPQQKPSPHKTSSSLIQARTKDIKSSPELTNTRKAEPEPELEIEDEVELEQEHEPSKMKIISESGDGELPPHEDPPKRVKSRHEAKVYPEKLSRVYKLPIVVGRHHGPGCAMEVSVLEKHEDNCTYKKEGREGRHIDDKVGSYDCIGRMVFRTCNPTEFESDSSGVTGNFTGLGPNQLASVHAETGRKQEYVSEETLLHEIHSEKPPHEIEPPHEELKYKEEEEEEKEGEHKTSSQTSQLLQSPAQSSSVYHSLKSEMESVNEEPIEQEELKPIQAKKKYLYHNVMMAMADIPKIPNSDNNRKHYHGDECKIDLSRNPFVMAKQDLEKAYTSKKTFPLYFADEGNQTDLKGCQISISTITDLSMQRKNKKTNFFAALFKRGSNQSSVTAGSKKSNRSKTIKSKRK